jgi:hypothetical protein
MARTTGSELASEAAIYAEGTKFHGRELAREYDAYADEVARDGGTPDDFQRWVEANHPECC